MAHPIAGCAIFLFYTNTLVRGKTDYSPSTCSDRLPGPYSGILLHLCHFMFN